MHYRNLHPSRFIRSSDIDGDKRSTIDRIDFEMVGQGSEAEEKPVVFFSGMNQGLVLNRTNSESIADLFGEDTDDWVGKDVVLYRDRVRFGAKMVDAVRIKAVDRQAAVLTPDLAGEAVDRF